MEHTNHPSSPTTHSPKHTFNNGSSSRSSSRPSSRRASLSGAVGTAGAAASAAGAAAVAGGGRRRTLTVKRVSGIGGGSGGGLLLERSLLLDQLLSSQHERSFVYVHLIGAAGLMGMDRGGSSDPYAVLQVGTERAYSTTLYSNLNPTWNEEYAFVPQDSHAFLHIRLYDEDLWSADDFLGEIRIPFWEYDADMMHERKFKLEPPRSVTANPAAAEEAPPIKGDLHIRFRYHLAENLDPLLGQGDVSQTKVLLNELRLSLLDQRMYVVRHLLRYLERSDKINSSEGEQVLGAVLIVYKFHSFQSTLELLEYTIRREVRAVKNPADLFRKNTVTPKLLSKYAQEVGREYLAETLRPLVINVSKSSKTFEIDPHRLKNKENLSKNVSNLTRKCDRVLRGVLASKNSFPEQLKWVAYSLRSIVSERFPEMAVNSLGSLVFLRFICPAMLSPVHFGVLDKLPKSHTMRFLMLIVKTLQTLSNHAGADPSLETPRIKEAYMREMSGFIVDNRDEVRDFLLSLTDVIGKSDVLPAFESHDDTELDTALQRLQTFVVQNIDRIFPPEPEDGADVPEDEEGRDSEVFEEDDAAPTLPEALGEFERVARELCRVDEEVRAERAKSDPKEPAGQAPKLPPLPLLPHQTPPRKPMPHPAPPSQTGMTLTLPGAAVSAAPEAAASGGSRDKPKLFARLRNRFLSTLRTEAPEVRAMRTELALQQEHFERLLDDRQLQLRERDTTIAQLHEMHRTTTTRLHEAQMYIMRLENQLRENNIELPSQPEPERSETLSSTSSLVGAMEDDDDLTLEAMKEAEEALIAAEDDLRASIADETVLVAPVRKRTAGLLPIVGRARGGALGGSGGKLARHSMFVGSPGPPSGGSSSSSLLDADTPADTDADNDEDSSDQEPRNRRNSIVLNALKLQNLELREKNLRLAKNARMLTSHLRQLHDEAKSLRSLVHDETTPTPERHHYSFDSSLFPESDSPPPRPPLDNLRARSASYGPADLTHAKLSPKPDLRKMRADVEDQQE